MPRAKPQASEPTARELPGATFRRQLAFWLLTAALFILFLFVFSSILLPFLAGMALAYFLDPVADRLQRLGLSRTAATVAILLAFIVLLALGLTIIIPVLVRQTADFASRLPEYLAQLQSLVTNLDPTWFERVLGIKADALKDGLNSLLAQGTTLVATLFQSIWSSGAAILNLVSLFIVTPVVAFYMLLDWDRMVNKVDSWIPREHVETVRALGRDMNVAIAGFVRGQGTLCLILGAMYAVGLTVVGLNFGLLIGLFAGLISFIPYVGSMTGLVLSLGVAFFQFWPEWYWIAAVLAVFMIGQFIEGNILQPKLVGKSVGLHPVWLMFALFAFGYLFGFVGLLVAVPAAAAMAVLVRFGLQRYLESPLYNGKTATPARATRRRKADRAGG